MQVLRPFDSLRSLRVRLHSLLRPKDGRNVFGGFALDDICFLCEVG